MLQLGYMDPSSPGCSIIPSAPNRGCGPGYLVEAVTVDGATMVLIRGAEMPSTGTPVVKSSLKTKNP